MHYLTMLSPAIITLRQRTINEWAGNIGWMKLTGQLNYWEENLSQHHFVHHKSHMECIPPQ